MANARKKNAIYVDTAENITVDASNPAILGILIIPSADNSRVTITESDGGTIVLDVKIEPTESRYLDFTGFEGIGVTSTFKVTTLTTAVCILYGKWYKET